MNIIKFLLTDHPKFYMMENDGVIDIQNPTHVFYFRVCI